MKIIFFGTGEFAVPIIRAVEAKADWDIALVVTEPPKPAGRGGEVTLSPAHRFANEHGLAAYTPETLKDPAIQDKLRSCGADMGLVVSYGKILPPDVLKIPPHGIVNIHYSLLPKLRGASPVQYALLKGYTETGVTLMVIDPELDHGPIISQKSVSVAPDDTIITLEPKLSEAAIELLLNDLPRYVAGDIKPIEQNHAEASFAPKIKKEDGHIDWSQPAREIYNRWRAFVRWPGVFSFVEHGGKRFRLVFTRTLLGDVSSTQPAGTIFAADNNLFVACGDGATVRVVETQPEGKRPLSAHEFINGYARFLGAVLL